MNQPTFLDSLEWELTLRGHAVDRAEVRAFVASAWPLIEDDPDLTRWAGEYAGAQQGRRPRVRRMATQGRVPSLGRAGRRRGLWPEGLRCAAS
jgi:hypothetical protein